ncbi:MAG: ribonuclease D [Propionibacteriaceae bacterium]|nr:ribonuclease D [Propionibacteriaceae bacterium]
MSAPADGVPPVTDSRDALTRAAAQLAAAEGPLAVDTERAQGFRYTAKAYLIQVRRGGSTFLIDPLPFERDGRADFSGLAESLAPAEWLIHAANQDLPCLAEVGLLPRRLFDTELAARLLGYPKVNLATVLETALGVTLRKEHSAADWSRRPLPTTWLNYAALDVELLAQLRDWLADRLAEAGKLEWAEQEFAHLVVHAADPPSARPEPWRRTSGMHDVRSGRGRAVVRELWQTRDQLAAGLDLAPHRLLRDNAIVAAAALFDQPGQKATPNLLRNLPGFNSKTARAHQADWLEAIRRAAALSGGDLPGRRGPQSAVPHPRNWAQLRPEAAKRWQRVRPAVEARAAEIAVPVENLVAPDALRQLLWDEDQPGDEAALRRRLTELEARPWQQDQLVGPLTEHW